MSTDRDRMLATIRAGVSRSATRDAAKPARLIPQRGQLQGRALVDLFRKQAETASATVAEVARAEDVPAAVAEYLRGRNLPPQIRLAPDARVEGLDWKSQPLLETTSGASDGHDLASVTPVLAGVAETGTLMVHSGEATPNTLHFCRRRISPWSMPMNWSAPMKMPGPLCARSWVAISPGGALPRTVSLVTGPSRSADIGKILLMGAHGPKRLHIILVDAKRPTH